ncbi:hypothetical protein FSP39_009477, partial [Pinctada imbricata]
FVFFFQAAIWDSLNHYAYSDATFLAERLYAEVANTDALFLLATCYFRSGKVARAYSLLRQHGCQTPQCKYLMARCCLHLNKLTETEEVLTGNIFTEAKTLEALELEFGNMSGYMFSLLGDVYSKTERLQKAIECYRKSLKKNPLLWTAFEKLCLLGDKADVTQVFQTPASLPLGTPATPVTFNLPSAPLVHVPPTVTVQNMDDVLSPMQEVRNLEADTENRQNSPLAQSLISYTLDVTPDNNITIPDSDFLGCPRTRQKKKVQTKISENSLLPVAPKALFESPGTPTFGLMPLDVSPSPLVINLFNVSQNTKAPRKPVTRQSQNQLPAPKPPPFNASSNSTNTANAREPSSGIQNNPPAVRRSSRLFGSSSSSVKENNKSQGKARFQSPRAVGRKTKSRSSKSQQEMNELNKQESRVDTKPPQGSEGPTVEQITQMQHQSLAGVLHLLQGMGEAFQALSQYNCTKAVELLNDLPPNQYNTGYVLCQMGKAYFEMADHQMAEKMFSKVRDLEPYHLEGMEIYSTTLWHLQKEVELSTLAQELSDHDKNSPEVAPDFAYAYTLLGHEYVFTEELDKAMSCFRNAIRVDSRHYNAWYGVGMIYYKQEKFSLAEVHFRKALNINSQSSALLCHIAVVQHAQQKSDYALITLNQAIYIDPKNPLCKFHKASILFARDKHEEALKELEQLKQIIPKESLVYFLIGKVHKKLGNTHLALMNFSWAMDLDPKGVNNQIKEAIDKRYVTEDEDSLVQLDDTGKHFIKE